MYFLLSKEAEIHDEVIAVLSDISRLEKGA